MYMIGNCTRVHLNSLTALIAYSSSLLNTITPYFIHLTANPKKDWNLGGFS